MRLLVSLLVWLLRAVFTSRRSLALENLASYESGHSGVSGAHLQQPRDR
jgi:hypothetical protein